MRRLAVQFQPGRATSAKVASVVSLMTRIAGSNVSLRGFAYRKGNDRGPYVNFQFEVATSASLRMRTVSAISTLPLAVPSIATRTPTPNPVVPAGKLAHTLESIVVGVFGHRVLGPSLRRSCIVTCEGTRGWDNYLLLYHFNQKLKLDTLRNV